MPEAVFDTSFLHTANGPYSGQKNSSALNRRLTAIRGVNSGHSRVRYNDKLLAEYSNSLKVHRNDVIEQFIELLDSKKAIRLPSSTLRHADKAKANECRWPTHDQHVLAAAVGGSGVVIHVTENALGACAKKVKRIFGIKINHVV